MYSGVEYIYMYVCVYKEWLLVFFSVYCLSQVPISWRQTSAYLENSDIGNEPFYYPTSIPLQFDGNDDDDVPNEN